MPLSGGKGQIPPFNRMSQQTMRWTQYFCALRAHHLPKESGSGQPKANEQAEDQGKVLRIMPDIRLNVLAGVPCGHVVTPCGPGIPFRASLVL
jgi:hypothetical protein